MWFLLCKIPEAIDMNDRIGCVVLSLAFDFSTTLTLSNKKHGPLLT